MLQKLRISWRLERMTVECSGHVSFSAQPYSSVIEEKGFEGASVQNIIDRAERGPGDVLCALRQQGRPPGERPDGLREALKEHQAKAHSRRSASDERLFAYSHEMFAHIAEYRTAFRAMVGKQSGALIQQLLHKIIVDLVRDDKSHGGTAGMTTRLPPRRSSTCRGRPLRASNVVGGWETGGYLWRR